MLHQPGPLALRQDIPDAGEHALSALSHLSSSQESHSSTAPVFVLSTLSLECIESRSSDACNAALRQLCC